MARHTPVSGEGSLPEHDVTEGFLALTLVRSNHLALICMSLELQHIICVRIYVITARTGIP